MHITHTRHNRKQQRPFRYFLSIAKGRYIAILGRNGSASPHLPDANALIIPDSGDIIVLGMNTKEKENQLPIRKKVGMIFQDRTTR